MSDWKIRFGTAGTSDSFAAQGYKSSLDVPEYTAKMGLNAFEYQCGRGVRLGLDKAAKINVRPPTRPKNISRIKTLRESRFSSGVIPRDRPTVPTAEAVSKRQVSMGSPSETLMIRPPVQHSVIYISEIVAAFFTTSSSMRRPKRLAFSLRRKVEIAVVSKTAMVVVFKPPAVDPGLPPISISAMVINCPASLKSVNSTVLKPAVRGVTA